MLISERNENLYELSDISTELIDSIIMECFEKGTVRGKNKTYINDFITMDIETSTIGRATDNPVAFTYSIAVYMTNKCFIFRTWKDYEVFMDILRDKLNLTDYYRLVCYVHNLPYEFQFMKDFMYINEVFATKPRKVVKCHSKGIEYRCSYKLTNMGLERFTNSIPPQYMKHGKLSGADFDYSKLRTPSTILTPSELDYIFNDVAGLYEALDFTIKNDEYNIATIPNTSTGFVRNELRYNMSRNPANRKLFLDTKLNQELYGLLREARRGGNTHCNPVYSNLELEDMTSMDMSSAYPAVMVECKFPMTPFLPVPERRLSDFELFAEKFACILDITLYNVKNKNLDTIPYIAKAHCTQFPKLDETFVGDNGRVLEAEYLSMVVTDIDYKIIKETYDFTKVECRHCFCSKYDYLPDELRKTILKQYYDKTTLKDQDEYLYMKQKNKFNANFGCMLTDICQDRVVYQPRNAIPFIMEKEDSYENQLERYYKSRNSFLSYQHGVWVTAHCRRRLQNAINALENDMVYCDTDSVKFFDTRGNRRLFEILNREILEDIRNCGMDCTVKYKGRTYTLGIWEPDGDYKYFKSMGAKKYCYIDTDDKFHITVAGLSKSKARDYLEKHGGIEVFKQGTIVPKEYSGRTSAKYNDYEKIHKLRIPETGEIIDVGSNLIITDVTYEFSLTEEYDNLLQNIKEGVMF